MLGEILLSVSTILYLAAVLLDPLFHLRHFIVCVGLDYEFDAISRIIVRVELLQVARKRFWTRGFETLQTAPAESIEQVVVDRSLLQDLEASNYITCEPHSVLRFNCVDFSIDCLFQE